jgi:hypothetical protein
MMDHLRSLGLDINEENVDKLSKFFQETVLEAAKNAMSHYFDEVRPGRVLHGEVNQDCSVNAKSLSRRAEFQLVGLNPPSLAVINDFDQLLQHATDMEEEEKGLRNNDKKKTEAVNARFKQFFASFAKCPLVRNQVTRFSNIEILPLRTTVRSGLLGPADFSSSTIRARYEAGQQLAQEQIVVAKFHDPKTKKDRVDLKFVPPPNEA